MIQVSVITDEITQDFERALDVALENDVRHAELRGLWDTNISNLSDEQAERAKALLDARNMKVTAIAGPFFKTYLGPEYLRGKGDTFGQVADLSFDDNYKVLARCCELAKFFGTDIVRTFAFWRSGDPTPEVYDLIEGHLKEAVARTEAEGLRLALENEHACFIGSSAEALEILSRVQSDSLGLIWDPGNAAMLEDPADVVPGGYNQLVEKLGIERFFHIHLKDPVVSGDKRSFTELGQGDLDYVEQFKGLVRDGYKGSVSMETHWTGEGLTKEQSTVRCLQAIWRIAEEAGVREQFE